MADLGKAYVQIIPKAEGITSKMNSLLGGAGKSAGAKAGKEAGSAAGSGLLSGMKKALTAAAIGAPIIAGVKAALDEGGKLQQSYGGLETLYGDAAEAAKKYATQAAQAGISANSYAEQAVSFGASLKQAFEGDTTKAVEAANTAILDMADNAAKMGTPIESVQQAYQGFAKGQYQLLDNLKLGYGGTKGEMERLLADAQKISGVKYDISNLGDVYDAIHVIQGDLGLTGVAAQEAATTLSGSFGAMKASASNFLANLALGEDIKAPMQQMITATGSFLFNNLMPMIGNIITALPSTLGTAISTAAPVLMEKAPELISNLVTGIQTAIPQLISFGSDIISTIGDGIKSFMPTLQAEGPSILQSIGDGIASSITTIYEKGGEIVSNLINGIGANAPNVGAGIEGLINSAVTFLETNLPTFGEKGGEMVGKIAEAIITNAPAILAAIGRLIVAIGKGLIKLVPVALTAAKNMLAGLGNGIKAGWSAIQPHVTALVNKITTPIRGLISKVRTIMNNVKSTLVSIWNSIKTTAGTTFNAVKEKITSPIEKAKSTVKSIMDKIKGFFPLSIGNIFSNFHLPHLNVSGGTPPYGIGGMGSLPHFSVDWYAKGGVFDNPSLIGVGEAGREAVVPLSGAYMRPFAEAIASEMSGSGGTTNYFNITVDGAENPENYARRLARELQLVMRTA